ncbi:glycosyltransferase [Rothia sp. CCM 9417]|uniref:glycosyltransferase n=1 Tax=Rothia sp. CCM 9417 TaxID=3402657 RepID=UPI003AE8A122
MEKISGRLAVIVRSGDLNTWVDEAVKSVVEEQGIEIPVVLILNGPQVSTKEADIEEENRRYPWLTNPKVRVVRFDHYLGMSGSIIEGMKHIDTTFVANLDGDDIALPGRFIQQINYLESNPDCVLVGARAHMIDEQGDRIGDVKARESPDIRRSLLLYNPIPHSSVMFRKDAYDKVGGHTPGLTQCEDYDLTLRIATRGKVALLPDFLVLYRVHTSNLSKGATPRGKHIDAVTSGRRQLAKTLGVSPLVAVPLHLVWRAVQFIRAAGLIRPLHEYFKFL